MSIDRWSEPITVEEMYGDWDYEAAVALLEESLDPRPHRAIFDLFAALGPGPGTRVLDIGGRDGTHALTMAERFGCSVLVVDPAPANIEDGRRTVADHTHGHLVELRLGEIGSIPADDDSFDLVFSRDMLGHVEDLDGALSECRRVLEPNGSMLLHAVFETRLLEPLERAYLCANTADVPERLSVDGFESAVAASGFTIESLDLVGSEWNEASQEAGTAPNYLLQLSRLRRDEQHYLDELGEIPYRVMYANALYGTYILIGKLEARVYVLRAPAA